MNQSPEVYLAPTPPPHNSPGVTSHIRTAGTVLILLSSPLLPLLPQAPPIKPVVWVLSTGGTIAGQGASSTSLDLLKAVPEIALLADVEVEQIANVGSANITIAQWLTLSKRINQIFS